MKKFLLLITVRNLLSEKKISFLNMLGLTAGFTFTILIFIFAYREFSFDNFHENIDRIYITEILHKQDDGTINKSRNLSISDIDVLRKTIPGIDKIAFLNYSYFDWDFGAWIEYDGIKHNLEKMAFTDGALTQVFSFETKTGNLQAALDDPKSIVLAESIADKIFISQNPIGQSVKLNDQSFTVQAVIKDLPQNSSIAFSGLLNYKASQKFLGKIIDDYSYLPFFLLKGKADRENVAGSIYKYFISTIPLETIQALKESSFTATLVPLNDIYFHDALPYDVLKHGNKTLTLIILLIGILIISLAVINYINLTIAGSLKWTKSYSVQRVFGLGLKGGAILLIFKSILLCTLAFSFSILLITQVIPLFNSLIEYPIQLSDYLSLKYICALFTFVILVAFVSGIIPGLFVARFSPAMHLRGETLKGVTKNTLWNKLLLFQLVISIVLISGSLIIYKQVKYATDEDIGIITENIIVLPASKLGDKKNAFVDLIRNNSLTVSQCLSSPYLHTFNEWGGILNVDGKEKIISYFIVHANQDFIPTLNLKVKEGRNFLEDEQSDFECYIINETAKEAYGITSIENAILNDKPIVGVVNDFNYNSFRHTIQPMAIWKTTANRTGYQTIHFNAGSRQEIADYMTFLKNSWQNLRPDVPFEYEFLDDRIDAMYVKEITLMNAIITFTALAIFISCLGLLGIVSFIVEVRTKEIGIRKVNGAGISEVMVMLNKDFVRWVSIAFIFATPIAWYAMNKWLQNFAYKTSLSWWIFALAGILALGIALLTVSWQSYRAASRNPVEALRYE